MTGKKDKDDEDRDKAEAELKKALEEKRRIEATEEAGRKAWEKKHPPDGGGKK
jgi:hypothetical protein